MTDLTIVAAVNNEDVLRANLLASPCLQGDHDHQLILTRGAKSAAEVYNAGIAAAEHPIVVLVHQDVYLPEGWPELFRSRWADAETRFGKIDVAGCYGVAASNTRVGKVYIRQGVELFEKVALPAQVQTIDELLIALPSTTGLRFDPALGFHFYGADIAMQGNAVVLDAPCHHNSTTMPGPLPPAFHASLAVFAKKWRERRPVYTSCAEVR
jgi:hypothetical protein